MPITLSDEIQQLLEERMKRDGFKSADDVVLALLNGDTEVERDPETLAAIRRGLEDARAGRSRPWEEVKQELIARHSKK